jgi:hypothetical protein
MSEPFCESLYQEPINPLIIETWHPLRCTRANPNHCGPTAVALLGIQTREGVEQYVQKNNIEELGIQAGQLKDLIQSSFANNAKNIEIEQNPHPIQTLGNYLRQKLHSDYMTIIALNSRKEELGHIISIARIGNEFILFEGQNSKRYMGNDLDRYFITYKSFVSFCSKHKNKRTTTTNAIRKTKKESPPIKTQKKGSPIKNQKKKTNNGSRKEKKFQLFSYLTKKRQHNSSNKMDVVVDFTKKRQHNSSNKMDVVVD